LLQDTPSPKAVVGSDYEGDSPKAVVGSDYRGDSPKTVVNPEGYTSNDSQPIPQDKGKGKATTVVN
jgi:hypothetical protein